MFKKVLSSILLTSLVISLGTISVSAEKTNKRPVAKGKTVTTTASEYDIIKQYDGKSISELKRMGFSDEDARKLSNLTETVQNEIDRLAQYSDSSLRQQGYSEKQIATVRNNLVRGRDKSLASKRGLFGDVEMGVSVFKDDESMMDPRLACNFYWEWTGRPFVKIEDGIGFAWDGGLRANSREVDIYIDYQDGAWPGIESVPRSAIRVVPGSGLSFNMDVVRSLLNDSSWCKSGWGSFYLTNPENKKSMQMTWMYGHKTYQVTGFCIDIKGALSLSVNQGVSEMMHDDRIFRVD